MPFWKVVKNLVVFGLVTNCTRAQDPDEDLPNEREPLETSQQVGPNAEQVGQNTEQVCHNQMDQQLSQSMIRIDGEYVIVESIHPEPVIERAIEVQESLANVEVRNDGSDNDQLRHNSMNNSIRDSGTCSQSVHRCSENLLQSDTYPIMQVFLLSY